MIFVMFIFIFAASASAAEPEAEDDPELTEQNLVEAAREVRAAGFETVNIGGPEVVPFALKLFNDDKDAIIATAKQANP